MSDSEKYYRIRCTPGFHVDFEVEATNEDEAIRQVNDLLRDMSGHDSVACETTDFVAGCALGVLASDLPTGVQIYDWEIVVNRLSPAVQSYSTESQVEGNEEDEE